MFLFFFWFTALLYIFDVKQINIILLLLLLLSLLLLLLLLLLLSLLLLKKTPTQVFPCEICEIFTNT